jgi:hypothetical protein
MERWKLFYETLNSKDKMGITEEVICQGFEVQSEFPTKLGSVGNNKDAKK